MTYRLPALSLLGVLAFGQSFNSGSTGADGALTYTTPGTVIFDPTALNLNAAGDNVFNFTTVNIGAGVTVKLLNGPLRDKPVVWLASGAVTIAGTLDLSGQPGSAVNDPNEADRRPADPGPGGYPGGVGSGFGSLGSMGFGPGYGIQAWCVANQGTGAAHATLPSCAPAGFSGTVYDNIVLVPLRGGSGGGGGGGNVGSGSLVSGGGGGGGGAIQIESSVSITLAGSILAKGGDGGAGGPTDTNTGGGGSGGAIHLLAPTITGTGILDTTGGGGTSVETGGFGRIRLDAFTQQFSGASNPAASLGTPYNVPAPTAQPLIRVTSIGGIPIPSNPTGNFTTPDAVFNQTGSVTVTIQGTNIPLNATVQLWLFSEVTTDQTLTAPVLIGTLQSSTTTMQVTFQPSYTLGFVRATW